MKLYGNRKKEPVRPASPPQEKPKKQSGHKGRIVLIICISVVALVLVLAVTGMVYVRNLNTIFPRVTMDGIPVGGMTAETAAEVLEGEGYGQITPTTVTVAMPAGYTLSVESDEVVSPVNVTSIADDALLACKKGSAVQEALRYVSCMLRGMALESEQVPVVDQQTVRAKVDSVAEEVRLKLMDSGLNIGEDNISIIKGVDGINIDCDALTEMIVEALLAGEDAALTYEGEITQKTEMNLDELYKTVHTECADAYYSAEEGLVPEVIGISFDVAQAQNLWDAAAYGEKVIIPLTVTQPEITAADLEKVLFRDKLSEKSTSLSGSSDNRINNVRRAAASINDVVLMPGDEFDYNKTLGKRTKENGYELAGAYSGGQTVQEYGGGICQVSSTLYYCSMYANLKITARTCHMFPVAYLPAGLDATVSWGGPEFRFVNVREYPIRIVASVDEEGKNVTVEIWGTDVDGSYVEVSYGSWTVYDATYTDVAIGYKAQTYRSVFDKDGNLISKVKEAASSYNFHDEDIKWPQEVLDERARAEAEANGETVDPIPTEPPAPQETEAPTETETPDATETPAPEETTAPTESPTATDPV